MYLECLNGRAFDEIVDRLDSVRSKDIVHPTLDKQDRRSAIRFILSPHSPIKETLKLCRVERSAHYHNLELLDLDLLLPLAFPCTPLLALALAIHPLATFRQHLSDPLDLFQAAQQEIRIQCPFVRFIDDNHVVL
jgi:hypothetical protein